MVKKVLIINGKLGIRGNTDMVLLEEIKNSVFFSKVLCVTQMNEITKRILE